MNRLPSTSVSVAPSPRSTTTGRKTTAGRDHAILALEDRLRGAPGSPSGARFPLSSPSRLISQEGHPGLPHRWFSGGYFEPGCGQGLDRVEPNRVPEREDPWRAPIGPPGSDPDVRQRVGAASEKSSEPRDQVPPCSFRRIAEVAQRVGDSRPRPRIGIDDVAAHQTRNATDRPSGRSRPRSPARSGAGDWPIPRLQRRGAGRRRRPRGGTPSGLEPRRVVLHEHPGTVQPIGWVGGPG